MVATGDLFTPIHKALRSMIYSLSTRLQTHDFADTAATEALVGDLEHDFATARSAGCLLCIVGHHAVDEESAVFPEVEKLQPRLIQELIEEHHGLARQELAIEKAGHELAAMHGPTDRIAAGVRLNQMANDLFAAYIAHMNREEHEVVPLMREHFTDAQMADMRGRILGGMPPDRMMTIFGWMLPSLNVSELTGTVGGMKGKVPPRVFEAVTNLCATRVDPARWGAAKLRIGI